KNEPKKRRSRTSSTTLWLLQEAFDRDPMPTAEQRAQLAEAAGMSVRNVQVWFQNRRAKTKLDTRRGS
ncbi:Homeodomain-like protein, partial [Geranomyces variabilis]